MNVKMVQPKKSAVTGRRRHGMLAPAGRRTDAAASGNRLTGDSSVAPRPGGAGSRNGGSGRVVLVPIILVGPTSDH